MTVTTNETGSRLSCPASDHFHKWLSRFQAREKCCDGIAEFIYPPKRRPRAWFDLAHNIIADVTFNHTKKLAFAAHHFSFGRHPE